jgi:hypothetical protein
MTKFLTKTGAFSITRESTDGVLDASSIILTYDSDIIYPKDSIVEFEGALYKANTIIDSTEYPFEEGADSEQWTKLSGGGGVTFTDSEGNFPENPSKGDEAYVTEDGTEDGKILQRWIYSGNKWVLTSGGVIVSATVLDNAIANSLTISEIGRYIVPDSDSAFNDFDSEFGGKANLYADFNGSTFAYSTPDSDDIVFITTGVNTGQLWTYKFGKWSEAIGSGVELNTYSWSITKSYFAGDMVIFNGNLFQANGNIPVNTAFVTGTSGATWRMISSAGAMPANYLSIWRNGQSAVTIPQLLSTNFPFGSFAYTNQINRGGFTIGSNFITVPATGTYKVTLTSMIVSGAAVYNSPGILTFHVLLKESGGVTTSFAGLEKTYVKDIRDTIAMNAMVELKAGDRIFYNINDGGVGPAIMDFYHFAMTIEQVDAWLPAIGQQGSVLRISSTGQPAGGNGNTDLDYSSAGTAARLLFSNANATIRGSAFTVGTNTITINTAGIYKFTANYSANDNGANATSIALQMGVNGTAYGLSASVTAPAGAPTQVSVYENVSLNVGDVVDFRLFNGTEQEVISLNPRTTILAEMIGTTNASAFLGALTNVWNITNSYPQGAIVVNNSRLYQANSTIPSNTAFVTGTGTNTWTMIGSGNAVAEFDQLVVPSTVQLAVAGTTYDVATFTLPSAGTWEVSYTVRSVVSTNGGWVTSHIATTGNVMLANSEVISALTANSTNQSTVTNVIRITTTGAEAFKLRATANSTTGNISSDNNGRTTITWKKISGFIPTNGSVTQFLSTRFVQQSPGVGLNADILAASLNTTRTNIPQASNTWTLRAGVTYDMFISFGADANTTNQDPLDVELGWVDSSNNAIAVATHIATNFAARGLARNGVNRGTFTPTTDTVVKLRIGFSAAPTTATISGTATIQQLGSTDTTSFTGMMTNGWNIANGYPSGTIVVKDGFIYQANAYIAPGTAFTTGTTGATWALLNIQQAEFDSIPSSAFADGQNTTGSVTLTGSSFTLPSAGTYEITYTAGLGTSASFGYLALQTGGQTVDSSVSQVSNAVGIITVSKTVTVTVTGSTTYNLVMYSLNSSTTTTLYSAAGRAGIVWKKISGFLPMSQGEPNWVNAGTIQSVGIGATTTAPTVGATLRNAVYYKQIGVKTWKVELILENTATYTGAAAGNGEYLLTLPNGLQWDQSILTQQFFTGSGADRLMANSLSSSEGVLARGGYNVHLGAKVIPYDAGRYRVMLGRNGVDFTTWRHDKYQLNSGQILLRLTFTFQAA